MNGEQELQDETEQTCSYSYRSPELREHRIRVVCLECGKKFAKANPEQCPRCNSSDLDLQD